MLSPGVYTRREDVCVTWGDQRMDLSRGDRRKPCPEDEREGEHIIFLGSK